MRILHTYCLNYNIGDYALGIGVRNLLRNFLVVDLIGITNIQGRYFDKYYINEVVNKRYDLLIIGGGGIIHGAHWPNGWFWLIEKDLIKSIRIPFIVYGVGNNYFENEIPIPEKAIIHLKETFHRASFFSVRNDGSYERLLEKTGIKAYEVPDPGFHVNLNTKYERRIKDPYILIQLANDKPEYRFGSLSNRQQFIESMKHIIRYLAKTHRVILAPHVFDDVAISQEVSDGIPNCEIWDFGYLAFDHSEIAIGYYQYAEFVLAMRGHGQILPISFNTPVISLQNHPKHMGLMKKLNLLQYNVNILDIDFEDKLRQTIENLRFNKQELLNHFRSINSNFLNESTMAFEVIKSRVNDDK
jgi:polysaccharide pyruvyl transferase WcaK-like protein